MNINSQFFIAYYAGAQELDLMNMPASFQDSDKAYDRAIYNRFIENISTIYSSQTSSGNIPIFWTVRSQVGEVFGNPQYSYAPSANSTLKSLKPRESYYFIVRDESAVPLTVPIISGEVPVDLATSLTFDLATISANDIALTGSANNSNAHQYQYSFSVSNLEAYETYNYEIIGLGGSWPVTATPISGTIKPSSSTSTIKTLLSFCANTGLCELNQDTLLTKNMDISQCLNSKNNGYQNHMMQLRLSPVSFDGIDVYSDQVNIECFDCLPRGRISSLGMDQPIVLNTEGNSLVNLDLHITGLNRDMEYAYTTNVIDANWPVLFVTPTSGTIVSPTSTFKKPVSLSFCPAASFCPVDNQSVFAYETPAKFIESYYIIFNLVLTSRDCDNEIIISEPITAYCNNCL